MSRSGSSSGLVQTTIVGGRVATGKNTQTGRETELLFTPPYLRTNDQKLVSAKLQIPVLVNIYGRNDPDHFRLVAWAGRADLFAKNLGKGKEMHWVVVPKSFWSDLFFSDGVQIMDRNGQPKTVRQISYTIIDFAWGADSQRTLFDEMTTGIKTGEGLRPQNWNVQGHADNQQWLNVLAARKNTFYMGGDRHGFAKVIYPKGGGTIILGDCSASAIRAAGGEQNFVQQCQNSGRTLVVQAGAQPTADTTGAGAPGGTMVANQNVSLEKQVATTLAGTAICGKCNAQIPQGSAFCPACGNQAPVAGATASPALTAPTVALVQAPPIHNTAADAV